MGLTDLSRRLVLSCSSSKKELRANDQSNETHVRAAATGKAAPGPPVSSKQPKIAKKLPKIAASISVIEPKHSRDSRDYLFRLPGHDRRGQTTQLGCQGCLLADSPGPGCMMYLRMAKIKLQKGIQTIEVTDRLR